MGYMRGGCDAGGGDSYGDDSAMFCIQMNQRNVAEDIREERG